MVPRRSFASCRKMLIGMTLYLDALRWANPDAGMALYERAYPQLQAAV